MISINKLSIAFGLFCPTMINSFYNHNAFSKHTNFSASSYNFKTVHFVLIWVYFLKLEVGPLFMCFHRGCSVNWSLKPGSKPTKEAGSLWNIERLLEFKLWINRSNFSLCWFTDYVYLFSCMAKETTKGNHVICKTPFQKKWQMLSLFNCLSC